MSSHRKHTTIDVQPHDTPFTVRLDRLDPDSVVAALGIDRWQPLQVTAGLAVGRARPRPHLRLPAGDQVHRVRVTITYDDPGSDDAPGLAVIAVIDDRHDDEANGVTIVVTTDPPPSTGVPPPNDPVPFEIATALYTVAAGAAPDDPRRTAGLPNDRPSLLVVPLRHTGRVPLDHVIVCLEHVGPLDISREVWHLGHVDPNEPFLATWTIDPQAARAGRYPLSVVVQADDHDPVRLRDTVTVTNRLG